MSTITANPDRSGKKPPYRLIARCIGLQLREEFQRPEAEPLPSDHVNLLLRLRHKERERARRSL